MDRASRWIPPLNMTPNIFAVFSTFKGWGTSAKAFTIDDLHGGGNLWMLPQI